MSNTQSYATKENLATIITKINTKLSNRYTKAQIDSAISSAINDFQTNVEPLTTEQLNTLKAIFADD